MAFVAGLMVAALVVFGPEETDFERRYLDLLVGLRMALAVGGGFAAMGVLRALRRRAGRGARDAGARWYRWRVFGYDVVDAMIGCVGFGVGSWICRVVLDGLDFEALRGQGFLVIALRTWAGYGLAGGLVWVRRRWGARTGVPVTAVREEANQPATNDFPSTPNANRTAMHTTTRRIFK